MSILTGYAIPTDIPGADHTYVTNDDPSFTWPCWGRSSGGRIICQGYGDASIANCLSQPNSWAGITYAVTGVCHQTANRILFPAGVRVEQAGGYGASVYLYGVYGDATFPTAMEWKARKALCGANLASTSASKIESNPKNTQKEIYIQKLVDLYIEFENMPTNSNPNIIMDKSNHLIKKGFEYLLEFRLGNKVDSQIVTPIKKQQVDILKEKEKKVNELYNGDISIEKYVKEINNLIRDALISLQDNLGEKVYEKIFNVPSSEKGFILIDPEIAKNSLKISINHK